MRFLTPLLACALAVSLVAIPVVAAEKDPFALMAAEQLGSLKLGLPVAQLKLPAGCGRPQKDQEQVWGADGEYHQSWEYKACGLKLGLVREKTNLPQQIFSLTVFAPSALRTRKGIGIGSTAQAALKAYAQDYNAQESKKDQTLVMGSIYGGLIFFLKAGKVKEIFIGAAAE